MKSTCFGLGAKSVYVWFLLLMVHPSIPLSQAANRMERPTSAQAIAQNQKPAVVEQETVTQGEEDAGKSGIGIKLNRQTFATSDEEIGEHVQLIQEGYRANIEEANSGIDGAAAEYEDVRPKDELAVYRTRRIITRCTEPDLVWIRTYDGSCNNRKNEHLGAVNSLMIPADYITVGSDPTGADRPSPRHISNSVSQQENEKILPSKRRVSELAVFFGQFVDHNIIFTEKNKPTESFEIPITDTYDSVPGVIHPNGTKSMPFARSRRGSFGQDMWAPVNSLSSFLDLSAVYGSSKLRADALRKFEKGMLRTSRKNMMPFNDAGLENEPSSSNIFFLGGDTRANEHPFLITLHTIWLREHNNLCKILSRWFPKASDEKLYQLARKLNIRTFQRIVFEEFYPVMTGRKLPAYRGYKKNANPSISSIFSSAAFRVGHDMVGPVVRRFGRRNIPMPSLHFSNVFFRPERFHSGDSTIAQFVRGMCNTVSQEVDGRVVSLLRNFLFTGIKEADGFDLVAMNIQRGRDHRLPSYREARKMATGEYPEDYSDIHGSPLVIESLRKAYGVDENGMDNIALVDAWVGMMVERHEDGSSMGKTALYFWEQQFSKLRDGDRFFYQREKMSNKTRMALSSLGGQTMRDVLLRNSVVMPFELRKNPWYVH